MADSTSISILDPGILGTCFTAQTTTDAGAIFALQPAPGGGGRDVSWTVEYPGAAPAAIVIDLQGCDGDPLVAANWFQLDTYNSVAAGTLRHKAGVACRFVRVKPTTLTTPGGGVTSKIVIA